MTFRPEQQLLIRREKLDLEEEKRLSPLASFSRDGIRRESVDQTGHRQAFALDGDRILHSRAYTRYIDKTQVFYLIKNDHITHRVLHVQLVSKIARTIGRFLGLNEDLIEAIALGHDIGHPPFGHDGESMLSSLCLEHGLPGFQHNVQSVLYLDRIEKKGKGWNLTLQTLDGILSHDGEVHSQGLKPARIGTFEDFDRKLANKIENKKTELVPMTLEGCVVRLSDTMAYIGRDIEDAIELKIIQRENIPKQCQDVLGKTNGTIVYRLVADMISNGIEGDTIGFSQEISESLALLKKFNYEHIYLNPAIKKEVGLIEACYKHLFESYLADIDQENTDSVIHKEFLASMNESYLQSNSSAAMVRDFLAGMTDNYFLNQAAQYGCKVPQKYDYPS